ncbi:MAG: zeta toxin family protein [Luteolibacter sp.]
MVAQPPTLYLFAGCNGAGKTTFARSFLTVGFSSPPRFLNADEIARGLSPFSPESVALKAGKLLLAEIEDCLRNRQTFALESTLSGHAQAGIFEHAKALRYQIVIHYLWIPSPAMAIKRVAQRAKKGGHFIPRQDVIRRYHRSLGNFAKIYALLADNWLVWDNTLASPTLCLDSSQATLVQLHELLFS